MSTFMLLLLLLFPQETPPAPTVLVEHTVESVLETVAETLETLGIRQDAPGKDRPADIRRLRRRLRQARREAWLAYQRAIDAENDSLAAELKDVYETLKTLETRVDRLVRTDTLEQQEAESWLEPGRYTEHGMRPMEPAPLTDAEELAIPLPLYHPLPATRYNRVEGFTLGLGIPPLNGDPFRTSRIYGELSYAFALKSWRYEIGLETRPRRRRSPFLPTLGVAYYRNTFTEDTWKMNPVENSLAAFFTRNDYYDYYEAEGWRLYLRQPLGSGVELIAGYRSERHNPLSKHTSWSLFDRGDFRPNSPIETGDLRMLFTQARAQRIYGTPAMPEGWTWLVNMEFARGMGGDFSYNRMQAELRLYLPLLDVYRLYLRSRYGMSNGEPPLQKQFTIGGVGTLRAYPQNSYRGTRMWIGNAELAIADLSVLGSDDHQFFFLADAGWTGLKDTPFRLSDVKVDAGFGVSLDGRRMRFEIAWPVGDPERKKAVIWFRLLPGF